MELSPIKTVSVKLEIIVQKWRKRLFLFTLLTQLGCWWSGLQREPQQHNLPSFFYQNEDGNLCFCCCCCSACLFCCCLGRHQSIVCVACPASVACVTRGASVTWLHFYCFFASSSLLMLTHYCHRQAARITSSPEIIFNLWFYFASTCSSGLLNVLVHFGCFLTLDPKCTGTFWASSMERLTFDPKCTGTFWAVLMGLWLLKCAGTFWTVSMGLQLTCFTFDPKCTGAFWTVSPFDTKCTGTF